MISKPLKPTSPQIPPLEWQEEEKDKNGRERKVYKNLTPKTDNLGQFCLI